MPDDAEPVACSLSAGDLEQRLARWRALGDSALVEATQTADGARQVYRAGPDVESELRELVRLEAECCPFLEFAIQTRDGRLVLDITGPDVLAHLHQPTRMREDRHAV